MTRSQLQLLGAVCLLVSWKVRDHSPITAQRLIEYTDYNVDLAALLVSAALATLVVTIPPRPVHEQLSPHPREKKTVSTSLVPDAGDWVETPCH